MMTKYDLCKTNNLSPLPTRIYSRKSGEELVERSRSPRISFIRTVPNNNISPIQALCLNQLGSDSHISMHKLIMKHNSNPSKKIKGGMLTTSPFLISLMVCQGDSTLNLLSQGLQPKLLRCTPGDVHLSILITKTQVLDPSATVMSQRSIQGNRRQSEIGGVVILPC